jgi:predicted amino acid racemase
MRYPVLEINLNSLRHNTRVELDFFRKHGIEIMGVNKVFNGMVETAEAIVQGGMKVVAESKIGNLMKLKDLPCEKALLRSPGLSEISDTVQYADISLAAEITAIEALSEEAVRQGKIHKVLLMIDMGDLREGIWFEELEEIEAAAAKILKLPGLDLYGLGTNFGCYGTVLATEKNAADFVEIAKMLEKRLCIKFKYLSGGNCSSYRLVEKGTMPKEINHLRIGAQHEFGIEYVEGRYLEGYCHSNKEVNRYVSDAYILKGEIIELREKPTVPVGELGMDSFMNTKVFHDRGIRKQAILSFGRQDVPFENIHPADERIMVLGQTSNHTILDIGDTGMTYRLGDIIAFEIDYTALLYLCNSPDIEKIFISEVS